MDSITWNATDQILPPEGQVVRTMSPGGIEADLKRLGRLWFHPDGSMYVYYTPQYWKPKNGPT